MIGVLAAFLIAGIGLLWVRCLDAYLVREELAEQVAAHQRLLLEIDRAMLENIAAFQGELLSVSKAFDVLEVVAEELTNILRELGQATE